MRFDDLQHRYGLYVAEMVRQSLSAEEFDVVPVDQLEQFLQQRTRTIYNTYYTRQKNDPTNDTELNTMRLRWQEAEDILNLVEAAESVAEATSLKGVTV